MGLAGTDALGMLAHPVETVAGRTREKEPTGRRDSQIAESEARVQRSA